MCFLSRILSLSPVTFLYELNLVTNNKLEEGDKSVCFFYRKPCRQQCMSAALSSKGENTLRCKEIQLVVATDTSRLHFKRWIPRHYFFKDTDTLNTAIFNFSVYARQRKTRTETQHHYCQWNTFLFFRELFVTQCQILGILLITEIGRSLEAKTNFGKLSTNLLS